VAVELTVTFGVEAPPLPPPLQPESPANSKKTTKK
jgi:hypothetical protein